MPTITLPIPAHELLAVLTQARAQGRDIREMVIESAKGGTICPTPHRIQGDLKTCVE